MKKIAVLVSALAVIAAVALTVSCDNKGSSTGFAGRTLSIITFAGEFKDQGFVSDFEKLTGAKVELQIVPNDQFEAKMGPLLKAGVGVPDVFTGEAGYVREYVEGDVWEPLNKAPYNADTKDMYQYAVDMATNKKGEVVALTYQTTPGGYFYRREMAKKYFGTDDPVEIAKLFTSWEEVYKASEIIKTKSNGTAWMFPGLGDGFSRAFTANRTTAWVNDAGEFNLDPAIIDYFKTAKYIRDNGYDAKLNDWGGPFFEGMNTTPDAANIFVYPWPTWGLMFILKDQKNSHGDWGVVAPVKPWSWGGTWMGIYKNSPNKDLAWAFIQMVTSKKYLEDYATRSGDFVSDKTVMEKLLPTGKGKTPALGPDFNHIEFFAKQSEFVSAKNITGEDRAVMQIVNGNFNEYLENKKDLDTAIASMKDAIKTAYPKWIVKN